MKRFSFTLQWLALFLVGVLAGCSDSNGVSSPPEQEQERVGFEVLEIQAPNSIRAWISPEITFEEFDALEVPAGWIKNQPRESAECSPDAGRFIKSPDSTEDGDILQEEYFGYNWFHSATVTQTGVPLDEEGLLQGSLVRKFHELTYNAGSCMILLISPAGEIYFRIGRDANRVSDEPTIPNLWRLEEYTVEEQLVIELFNENLVIRTDNQDSFQGPIEIPGFNPPAAEPDPLAAGPLSLTNQLCEDTANMDTLMDSPIWSALIESGQLNREQVDRMVEDPTGGPFYMLNLILYREQAQYRDGRETDLTGREANAIYSPIEFLTAIGARIVFNAAVDAQIDGDDYIWDDVAIVEYPCPVAFFSMIMNPEFQARAVHKDAGVEKTIVMVTHLQPSPVPPGFEFPEPEYPATEEDPAFELIHVMDFHDIAQYEEGADEPERTGAEAWAEYQASGGASIGIGSRLTAILDIQGAIIGADDRSWDEAYIVHMPSMAGFQALLADETRQEGRYHRLAALADNYSMITYPIINSFPDGSDDPGDLGFLPITDTGVGTICTSDADCVGIGFCLSDGNGPGFCSRVCGSGECGDPYVCCSACSEAAAPLLPFSGSACMVDQFAEPLTAAPVSCTCE